MQSTNMKQTAELIGVTSSALQSTIFHKKLRDLHPHTEKLARRTKESPGEFCAPRASRDRGAIDQAN